MYSGKAVGPNGPYVGLLGRQKNAGTSSVNLISVSIISGRNAFLVCVCVCVCVCVLASTCLCGSAAVYLTLHHTVVLVVPGGSPVSHTLLPRGPALLTAL